MDLQSPPTTLEQLGQLDPNLEKALRGTSMHFFEPHCPNTYLEVGHKPFHSVTLQFVPNQPVSRAWDLVFRVLLTRAVNQEFGLFPAGPARRTHTRPDVWRFSLIGPGDLAFDVSPQTDPAYLVVELDGPVSDETKRFATALNYACNAANAVVPEAIEQGRRDHEELARVLGLTRPQAGFTPDPPVA